MKSESTKNSEVNMRTGKDRSVRWPARVLFTLIGIIIAASAFIDPRFRDAEMILTGLAVLPISIGTGLVFWGYSLRTDWKVAGFWFLTGLIGHAVCLQLIMAGPDLRYQHYVSSEKLFSGEFRLFAVFLLVQTVIVTIGIGGRFRSGRIRFAGIKVWQIIIAAFVVLVPTAVVSHDKSFYLYEWVFAGFLQTVQLGNIILFGLSLPETGVEKLKSRFSLLVTNGIDGSKLQSKTSRRLIVGIAIASVFFSAFLNQVSYENHPHVPDEVAYLIHARLFANGAMSTPAPPVPEAFEAYLLTVKDGKMYPAPPPGWPIFLAIGSFFGLAWLVNPILAGLNVLLTNRLLEEIYSPYTALIGSILLAISPWFIFLGMSFMTHMAALTCALIAMLGVAYARRTKKAYWGWAAGAALGMLALIRPLEAVGMAAILGLWGIGLWGKRISMPSLSGLVLGSILIGAVGLFYNAALTGDPTKFPIMEYTEREFGPSANAYGFGADRGMGWAIDPNPGHGPLDALINSNLNATQINTELFGWSIGSLLLIALFFCFRSFKRIDYFMLALIAIIYGLHFFYYFSGGPDFGARYWFLMIVPLVVLSARAVVLVYERLEGVSPGHGVRLIVCLIALSIMTFVNFVPWRAIDKYHNFRGMQPYARKFMKSNDLRNGLVLVRGNKHPEYDSAMIYNSLDLDTSETIFAWDKDKDTRLKLLQSFPDRRVWVIRCPSVTGRGFELTGGKSTAREILGANGE